MGFYVFWPGVGVAVKIVAFAGVERAQCLFVAGFVSGHYGDEAVGGFLLFAFAVFFGVVFASLLDEFS